MGAVAVLASLMMLAVAASASCVDQPWPYNNTLTRGQALTRGQSIASSTATLTFQTDGNVVLQGNGMQLWATNSTGPSPARFMMTMTGDLQLLSSTNAILWSAGTAGGSIFVVQDDCNAAVYQNAPTDTMMWSTGTVACLEVHIVMHSHDDVGWLLTPERYFDGCETPGNGVDGIITTIVQALNQDSTRKFSQVEQYFFNRWWVRQDPATQQIAKRLAANGQLEFTNGGWSMHDEACVHQESAISNMEVGARFLRETFGGTTNVTVGWHIDPFGHASATPRLMAQMGFNAFFFWRTDYQQRAQMIQTKTLETVWDSSPSLGDSVLMFTSIMPNGYCQGCQNDFGYQMCPSGFCCFSCEIFEGDAGTTWSYLAMMDTHAQRGGAAKFPKLGSGKTGLRHRMQAADAANPHIENSFFHPQQQQQQAQISQQTLGYVSMIRTYAGMYRTNQVMIPWGCDFEHQDAHVSFNLMDQVINEINANAQSLGMRAFYSTPATYVKAVHDLGYSWPINKYDYFLDSDNGNAYWSGYLSSRAEYKGFDRYVMNQRTSVDMALSAVHMPPSQLSTELARVEVIRQACGLGQHHDCITGTERQSVRDQYQFLLSRGVGQADLVFNDTFLMATGVPTAACPLSNLSSCPATNALSGGAPLSVYVFNPLKRARREIITVPVPFAYLLAWRGNTLLEQQLTPTWNLTTTVDNTSPAAPAQPFQLTFAVDLQPLELAEIAIRDGTGELVTPVKVNSGVVTLSNDMYTVNINGSTGLLMSITNNASGMTSSLSQQISSYCPMAPWGGQAAGAYIMRTCNPDETPVPYASTFSIQVLQGQLCEEVRQVIDPTNNIHQAIRVCKGQNFVEIQTGIGEIQTYGQGREVIMQFTSDVPSGGVWYTDSQGLEMQRRQLNSRPNYAYTVTEPVAGNFFPSNAFVFINSSQSTKSLAVVGDRSRAAASLSNGELEFLVQRRLIYDDNRGVNQALDEETRVLTTSRLVVNSNSMIVDARINSLLLTHPAIVRYGNASTKRPFAGFQPSPAMPANLHLHTRTIVAPGTLVLRVQHLFAVDEGAMAAPAVIDLRTLLASGMTLVSMTETDMNAVTPLSQINRMNFKACDVQTATLRQPKSFVPATTPVVTVNAMEIRTFVIQFSW